MRKGLLVNDLIVLAKTPDNKLRLVPLSLKQSARVRRYVTLLHRGSLHVDTKDLLVMTEADALAAFNRLTGKVPIKERFRVALKKLIGRAAETPSAANPS